jgi:uncharacterized lipoprotein YddW (UPF0748 family)
MKRAVLIIGLILLLLLIARLPHQQTAAPTPTLPTPRQLAAETPSLTQPTPPQLAVETPSPAQPTPQPAVLSSAQPVETRALWVVRHTMTSPDAVRNLVRRAQSNGFTDLVVQVRGRGDAYYNSSLEPRAEELASQPGSFDPLALVVDEAHRAGLKVHAWINIYLVANINRLPGQRDHVIYKHPEWIMVPRGVGASIYDIDPKAPDYLNRIVAYTRANRTDLEGLFVTPAHKEVQDNLYHIWMEVATRYAVDGLHFDYVRYPNPQFDYSRPSLDRFRAEMDRTLPEPERLALANACKTDRLAYAAKFSDRYAQFQRRQVSDLVERIYKGVKAARPNVSISAAVFADDRDAVRSRYQDWKAWLQQGWLDVVCPMAYTPDTQAFRKQIANAVRHAAGRKVWGGIGAYKQSADAAIEKVQASRQLGADGFILFSYDSSITVSTLNPQGDYLEKFRAGLNSEMDR